MFIVGSGAAVGGEWGQEAPERVSGPWAFVLCLLRQGSSVPGLGFVSRALFTSEIPRFRRIILDYRLILDVELYLREYSMWLYV